MRAIRGKVGVVAALVLAVALALTALAGLGARPQEQPVEGSWAIQLVDPQGDWSACLDDPAIEGPTTWQSTVTLVLVPGSTEADVERVTDCLSGAMTGGSIQVGTVDPVDA